MVNISVICIGKLKEKYLRDACDEYQKRFSTLCKLNIIELMPEKLSDNPSQKEIENALKNEGKAIASKIPNGARIFTMCIEGKQLSSVELSDRLEELAVSGISHAVFIIGGSFGLSDEIKKMSHVKLSMSKMTFPHQIARVMLLEQLYRAAQISLGTKYHK